MNGGSIMHVFVRLVFVAAVSVVAVGCGGSSTPQKSAAPSPQRASASATMDAAVHAALQQRMSAAGTFAGEHASPPTIESGDAFIAGDNDAGEAAAFRSEHLRGAAVQHATVPGADDSLRLILAFPDAQSAQADSRRAIKAGPAGSNPKIFAIPGIPGAQGNELVGPDGVAHGINAIFTVGPFEYIVGVAPTSGAAHAPTRIEVSAVAVAWYHRVGSIS